MTSPIPGLLTWPILLSIALNFAGRCVLLRERPVDRLINRALVAAFVGLLLREAWFEQALAWVLPGDDKDVIHLARQLSLGAILVIVMHIYGIAQLWAGADPDRTWHRQRRYDLITAAITAVILIAGTPARRADQLVDQALGPPAVLLWLVFSIPIGATALFICRLGVRDLRGARITTWQERMFYVWMFSLAILLGIEAIFNPVESLVAVLTDRPVLDPEMGRKAWAFYLSTVGATSAVGVPMISALFARLGWDRTGRYVRRLRPMWAELTEAVPEVVLELPYHRDDATDQAIRLHRMTIEIRDVFQYLERYSDHPGALEDTGGDPDLYVRRVAEAIAAKHRGRSPNTDRARPRYQVRPGARDLTVELRQLLALAAAWRRARAPLTPRGNDAHPTPSPAG